ncbi:MAG: Asp-tRNA(Asn)/Glu-tRNA(Gln) amidotransferase subunit GatC, partial [Acidobacteriota bacterium]
DVEVELFTRQLTDILAHCEDLQRIDTTGVPPTLHALTAGPGWRDDRPAPSLDRDVVLAQAPGASPAAGLFKVPKVL